MINSYEMIEPPASKEYLFFLLILLFISSYLEYKSREK